MSVADPVFVALVNKLPLPGTYWPVDERMAWLQACESVFNLIYGREPRVIEIAQPEPPAAPMVDPPKVKAPQVRADRSAPHPRVGSRRPEGIPTTFTMVQTVLKEVDAFTLSARDVMAKIEERWWPGLGPTFLGPDISSFISMYRLTRNADGKLALTEKGASMISEDLRHRTKGEFQEPKPSVPEAVKTIVEEIPAPAKMPANPKIVMEPKVKPAITRRPETELRATIQRQQSQPVKFDHNDKTTYLATMREYVIAGKLRMAMGKGHVSEAFLAQEIIGSNTESNRDAIKLACRGMNESLAEVGLKIEFFEGYGLLMKDVVA